MVDKNGRPSERAGVTPEVKSLIDDAQGAVRKELLTKFATWIIAGGVALFGFAAIGWWFYFKPILVEMVGGVPSTAIVAFDNTSLTQDKCPAGWSRFLEARGRVIVGAGDPSKAPGKMPFDERGPEGGKPLVGYVLRQHGGMPITQLTITELPPHSHEYESEVGVDGNRSGRQDATFQRANKQTSIVGGGQPFTNMPPYVALFYCKKD